MPTRLALETGMPFDYEPDRQPDHRPTPPGNNRDWFRPLLDRFRPRRGLRE